MAEGMLKSCCFLLFSLFSFLFIIYLFCKLTFDIEMDMCLLQCDIFMQPPPPPYPACHEVGEGGEGIFILITVPVEPSVDASGFCLNDTAQPFLTKHGIVVHHELECHVERLVC